ncbi:MAG TPA: MFS transporter [Candidatus Mediterraneibacter cottocaccae]|nr:MFS transporter [Candidatus Mediterraneibacter cottocaccae]
MKKNKAKDPNHLGFGRLMAWKSSDISAGWVNVIMLNYLSIYASDYLGLNIGVVGSLLFASKLLDGLVDFFIGWLVDNTHTRWGKARPYEICIVGQTLATLFLFLAKPEWEYMAKLIWVFSLYTLTFSVFGSLRAVAMPAYQIRHFSNNSVLIRKAASYGGIITMAGSMVASALFPALIDSLASGPAGWLVPVAVFMIPATLIGVLRFILCKEDPEVEAASIQQKVSFREIFSMFRQNPYVWLYALIMLAYNISVGLGAGAYYFQYIIGDMGLAGMLSVFSFVLLPLMLLFPWIMKKIGSMSKMVAAFSVIGVIGYIICFIAKDNLPGVLAGYLLGQFAVLPLAYYGVLFLMNVCSYNEMKGLPRMDGSANILANFCSNFGGSLGSLITGLLLMLAGYVSGTAGADATQPASALMMIRIDFAIIPAILIAVIGICCLAFAGLEPKAEAFEAEKKAKYEAEHNEADTSAQA